MRRSCRKIDLIFAELRKEDFEACNRQLRIEGERSSGRGPRLIRSTQNRQCRSEKNMAQRIVPIDFDGSPQPSDGLLMAAKVDLGGADKH
jgi:hypothetical protein